MLVGMWIKKHLTLNSVPVIVVEFLNYEISAAQQQFSLLSSIDVPPPCIVPLIYISLIHLKITDINGSE